MRSFFLSSAIKRLCLIAALVAFCFFAFAVIALSEQFGRWTEEVEAYRDWTIGGGATRCEKLLAEATLYMTPSSCNKPKACPSGRGRQLRDLFRDLNDDRVPGCDAEIEEYRKCDEAYLRQQSEVVSKFLDSGCETNLKAWRIGESATLTLYHQHDPGSLITFTWRNTDNNFEWATNLVAFAAALFFLTCIIRDFILETHVGWRRLTIVLSVVTAIVVPAIQLDDIDNPLLLVLVAIAALVGCAAIIIYGRKLVIWVYSGFRSEMSPSAVIAPAQTSGEVDLQKALQEMTPTRRDAGNSEVEHSINARTIDGKRVVLPAWQAPLSPLKALLKGLRLAVYLLFVAFVVEVTRRIVTGDQPLTFNYGMSLWFLFFASAQPPYFSQTLRTAQKAIAFAIGVVVGWVCQQLVAVFVLTALVPMIDLMRVAPFVALVVGTALQLVPPLLAYVTSKAVVRRLAIAT